MERTILIVDDVSINRKVISSSLQNKLDDIRIIEAADGAEALRILAEEKISVILLDIIMPGKNGIEVLAEIKTSSALQNIPVIICSALDEIKSVEQALSLGALDYLTKPLTAEQMRITLPLKVKNALDYYEQKVQLLLFHDHITEEMQLAEKLQKAMLTRFSSFDGAEIWSRYIPCGEIGGDFFCCKSFQNKIWLMIADVSGNGIAAAMVSTMINVLFNAAIALFDSPGVVLQSMNQRLIDTFKGSPYGLISAFVGCVDNGILTYANAGHPYPFIDYGSKQEIYELRANGFLLGVMDEACYETQQCSFGSNDSIILYTDGLFDNGEAGKCAEWSLVRQYYTSHREEFTDQTDSALDRMIDFFASERANGFIDDAAVMIVRPNLPISITGGADEAETIPDSNRTGSEENARE